MSINRSDNNSQTHVRLSAQSPRAQQAEALILDLQEAWVSALSAHFDAQPEAVSWLRDQGQHGGGTRYVLADSPHFNRASVNMSQVQYEDEPAKNLASATALSTIFHPQNPFAPSLHMHISWTELKSGRGYWRLMADLNPALPNAEQRVRFEAMLQEAAGPYYAEAKAQGERYFYIPSLKRHRGVAHFYLENFVSGDEAADCALAERVGRGVIALYPSLILEAERRHPQPSAADFYTQLAYHSLYFLQVLTLDRGTSLGLLVHSQNDQGILGSLPARVDRALLQRWVSAQPAPQDQLLQALVTLLPEPTQATPTAGSEISAEVKAQLAACLRQHYRDHPEAQQLQASGHTLPPTVANHLKQ